MMRLFGAMLVIAGLYGGVQQHALTSGLGFLLAVLTVAVLVGPMRLVRGLLGLAMIARALAG
jgi:hypothetical protein